MTTGLWAQNTFVQARGTDASPLPSLELALKLALPVEGRVTGLDAEELKRLLIIIRQEGYESLRGGAFPQGQIESPPVAPGEHRLHAFVQQTGHRLERKLTVSEGQESLFLNLQFQPGADVEIQVVADGKPVQARYLVTPAEQAPFSGTTGHDGRISLQGVTTARAVLILSGPFGLVTRELNFETGLNQVVELTLGDLEGQIVNRNGQPVSGAHLGLPVGLGAVGTIRETGETSNQEGRFSLHHVSLSEDTSLVIDHPDYALTFFKLPQPSEGDGDDLEIVLDEAGSATLIITGMSREGESDPLLLRFHEGQPFQDSKAQWLGSGRAASLRQLGREETRFRLITPRLRTLDFTVRPGQVLERNLMPSAWLELTFSPAVAERAQRVRLWDARGRAFTTNDFLGGSDTSQGSPGWPVRRGQVRLPALRPGNWRVELVLEDGETVERQVDLKSGETRRIEFP